MRMIVTMEALPAGPQATRYNDWAEVVAECRVTAYRLADKICVKNCRIDQHARLTDE